jgi:undecaprenyl-diphosphatase
MRVQSAGARAAWLVVGLAVVAVVTVTFAALVEEVVDRGEAVRLDEPVVEAVVRHRTPTLTAAMRAATRAADGPVVALVASVATVALLAARHGRLALFVAATTSGTAVLVAVAKAAVGRHRPPVGYHLVEAGGPAFPSGHAAQAVACYGAPAVVAACLLRGRAARTVALAGAGLVAGLVGVSRVYLGVHWPSDVLSGWALGAAWLATAALVLVRGTPTEGPGAAGPGPGAGRARDVRCSSSSSPSGAGRARRAPGGRRRAPGPGPDGGPGR